LIEAVQKANSNQADAVRKKVANWQRGCWLRPRA
jgi:hypothetical protein